jgi:hypothetical protein
MAAVVEPIPPPLRQNWRYLMAESATRKPAKSDQPSKTAGAKGRAGSDIPDESKERHTEIAVEAGNKEQHHRVNKK